LSRISRIINNSIRVIGGNKKRRVIVTNTKFVFYKGLL